MFRPKRRPPPCGPQDDGQKHQKQNEVARAYSIPTLPGGPRPSNRTFFCPAGNFCPIGKKCRKLRMARSRRHERPRSSNLDHSASFRAGNPNKASMTLMLAAASICATDALERHLAPPGFQCCERDLLARPKRRDWSMRNFRLFSGSGNISRSGSFFVDWMLWVLRGSR